MTLALTHRIPIIRETTVSWKTGVPTMEEKRYEHDQIIQMGSAAKLMGISRVRMSQLVKIYHLKVEKDPITGSTIGIRYSEIERLRALQEPNLKYKKK